MTERLNCRCTMGVLHWDGSWWILKYKNLTFHKLFLNSVNCISVLESTISHIIPLKRNCKATKMRQDDTHAHTLIQKSVCFIFEDKLLKPLRASGLHYCNLRSSNDGLWLLITWHRIIKQCQHAATAAAKRSCEKINVDGCHSFLIKWKEVFGMFCFCFYISHIVLIK